MEPETCYARRPAALHPSFKKKLLTSASDMSRFRSQLSRLNAALAKRVLSELPQRPCSDTTLLRAVRNCAEMGQGRLTRHGVALHRACLYDGHWATQTPRRHRSISIKPSRASRG